MVTLKQAQKLTAECLNELYENSNPPISWHWVKFFYQNTGEKFYENHKISEDKYNEIVKKYEKRLGKYYARSLSWELLNYAPMTDYGKK
jgi:hypothetical protein